MQAAETELSSGNVTVTGTVTGDKLVDYIYRRTGKLAKVIPPPPPPPPPPEEDKKEEAEKKPEEDQKPPEEKKEETPAAKKEEEEKSPAAAADEKKDEKAEGEANMQFTGPEEMVKRMMYWNGGGNYFADQEADYYNYGYGKQRMPVPWMPVYVVEHHQPPPPPQLFSDENPNACCIS